MSAVMRAEPLHGSRCLKATLSTFEAYSTLRQTARMWQEAEQRLGRLAPHAVPLLQDLFTAFYDPSAELNSAVDHALSWNFSILASLIASREFKELCEETSGDAITSAGAALHLAESLVTAATNEESRAPRGLGGWLRRALSPRRTVGRGLGLGGFKGFRSDAELHYMVGRSLRRAKADVLTDRQLRATWGIGPGIRSAHAFDDIWQLLAEIRQLDGFAELTDALGRFREILKPAASYRSARRGSAGANSIAGYTWGGELDRVAPEEAVRLTDPAMAGLFYEAYEHRRLLQHDVKGESKRSTGPIICCMDTSASMNAPAALERERFLWCKGLGLALLDFSNSAGRPYLGLCFSSEADLEAFAVPVGQYTPGIALEMAKCDFNGGTHFERPLRRALEYAEGSRNIGENERAVASVGARVGRSSGVDLVFIADGEATLRAAFREEFRQRKAGIGLHLFTVFIDGYHDGLAELSDAVFTVRSDRIDSWEAAANAIGRRLGES